MYTQTNEERIRYLEHKLSGLVNPDTIKKVQVALDKLYEANAPERAHDEDGHFAADDPSTKEINEAWKSGKAPKKNKDK